MKKKFDVFVSHASEDKEEVVKPLVRALKEENLKVWYDKFELKIGDSLVKKINTGLADSEFGVVVLSKNFFEKKWTEHELRILQTKSINERGNKILPIWHKITLDEVLMYDISLADIVAGDTAKNTIQELAKDISSRILKCEDDASKEHLRIPSKIEKSDERSYFIDSRDNKEYKTIEIGGKIWMAENFNYNSQYSKCHDNSITMGGKYGRLYDWKTAVEICPKGWHLPTKEEWETLVDLVGDYHTSGKKLKAKNDWYNYLDTTGVSQIGNGTDEFNFTALPGGLGDVFGNLYCLGYKGVWWSATQINDDIAYSRGIDYNGDYMFIGSDFKMNLLSVRYVKD